jgi:hypothetical protein
MTSSGVSIGAQTTASLGLIVFLQAHFLVRGVKPVQCVST